MKTFLLIFLLLFTPSLAFSKSKSLSDTKKSKTIRVLEMSKPAKVYKKPNFDSKILIKLQSGKRLLGTVKTYEGTDGFGLFHKVKLKKGLFGYIVDTDVLGFKPIGQFSKPKKKKRNGFFSKKSTRTSSLSPTRSKSAGLSYAYMNYNIKASGDTLSSGSSLFGLKLTGPWIASGWPLDITFLLSPNSPSFFDSVSTESTGFFGFLDVSYQSPFLKGPNQEAYWSIGPTLSYYSFDIVFNGETEPRDSSQLDIGFSLGLGWAYNFEPFVLRVDGKYFRTNESQYAAIVSLQRYF